VTRVRLQLCSTYRRRVRLNVLQKDDLLLISLYAISQGEALVVIGGIDPPSLAYEASAHPSTPYHRNLVPRERIELPSSDYKTDVLPFN
jgi:hypothetical protein